VVSDIVIGPARTGLLTVLAALILGTVVAMFMQQEQATRQIERARLAPAQPTAVQMPLG
jgi:HAMP domain-containing protein